MLHSRRPALPAVLLGLFGLLGSASCATGTAVDASGDPIDPGTASEGGTPGPAADGSTKVPESGVPGADASSRDGATATDAATTPDGATATDAATTPDGATATDAGVDAALDAGSCRTAPPSNACGVNPQCGCTGTQTCDVTNMTTGAVACVSAGAAVAGRPCTATSGCAQGLTCWNGACRGFCTRGQPNCGVGTLCFAPQGSGGATTPNLDVCSVPCDVSRPSTACGANACVWFSSGNVADCRPAGPGPELATCGSTADCRQGLVCINDPFFGPSCVKWCRLGSNVDCSFGDTCTDAFGASGPTTGGTRLGVCVF